MRSLLPWPQGTPILSSHDTFFYDTAIMGPQCKLRLPFFFSRDPKELLLIPGLEAVPHWGRARQGERLCSGMAHQTSVTLGPRLTPCTLTCVQVQPSHGWKLSPTQGGTHQLLELMAPAWAWIENCACSHP